MRVVLKLAFGAVFFLVLATAAYVQEPVAMKVPAPELQGIEDWINSKPLTLKYLRGQVVVLHFWTFG